MDWHDVFPIWYIGCFCIVFGLAIVWRGAAMSSCSRFFYFELREPALKERFADVIRTRQALEGDNSIAWRVTGLCAVLFGLLVLARAIAPAVGYALLCVDFAVVTSQIYLSMRNRSVRRAASLQPRSAVSAVPLWLYAGGALSALLPLGLWSYPSARGASILVVTACAVIVFVAIRTSEMAALLAGRDPEIEVYVDSRLRWSRVAGLLVLAYGASFAFIAMTGPSFAASPPFVVVVDAISWLSMIGFVAWALTGYVRGRLRASAIDS